MTNCPNCKEPGAYQGFNSWECANRDCKYFTEKQFKAYMKELSDDLRQEVKKQKEPEINWENFNKLLDDFQMKFPFGDDSDDDPICLKIPHTIFCYDKHEDYIKHLEMINSKWCVND